MYTYIHIQSHNFFSKQRAVILNCLKHRKSDFLEKVSQTAVRSLRGQF